MYDGELLHWVVLYFIITVPSGMVPATDVVAGQATANLKQPTDLVRKLPKRLRWRLSIKRLYIAGRP